MIQVFGLTDMVKHLLHNVGISEKETRQEHESTPTGHLYA